MADDFPDFFDAHCHAPPPGGGGILCAVSPADWDAVAEQARVREDVTPAFGAHPWSAGEGFREEDLKAFLVRFPRAWAGEIGLDAARKNRVPMDAQKDVLARQLRVAARLRRGVNLHCVRAGGELLPLLGREYFSAFAGGPCILHSFGGSAREAAAFAERGAYFSVGPLFARLDSPKIRSLAAALPEARLLLESDSVPGEDAGAREALRAALRWLAGVRGISCEALSQTIASNVRRLFHGFGS